MANDMTTTDNSGQVFALLEKAVAEGTDPAALEKLVDLQERILDKQAAQAYADAMAAFQAVCPPIIRSASGHHGKYADYETIMHTIGPPLADNGLSVSFDNRPDCQPNMICLDVIVMHRLGHSVRFHVPSMPDDKSGSKNALQGRGSSMKYAQRYGIIMALNLRDTGEADDDGGAGGAKLITDEQAANIECLITEVGADLPLFLQYMNVAEVAAIPARDYQRAVAALERKRGA